MGRGASKAGGGSASGGGLSKGEKLEMAEHYIGPEGFEMNKYARGLDVDDFYGSKEEIAEWTKKFTKVMDEQSLGKATKVYRGASFDTVSESLGMTPDQIKKAAMTQSGKKDIVGKTITEKGFMSTAKNMSTASSYSSGVVMTIKLPKGAKAVSQKSLTPMGEDEITVQRNSKLKITGCNYGGGKVYLECTYVDAN